MSSATRFRRSAMARLADASGAPRPLLPEALRAAGSEPATVIHLRPAPDPPVAPGSIVDPARKGATPGEQQAAPPTDVTAGSTTDRAADRGADDSRRIAGIARSVAQGALEVLAGTRPLQQMARWLDHENYERLQLRTNLVRCIGAAQADQHSAARTSECRHVIVRSARVCPVGPGVYEASVVAFDQKRVRAVALRIEQRRGAWRVTALEIG